MKVTIFLEHRFQLTPDGNFWAKNSFSYSFWQPYLKVFSQVEIIARVENVDKNSDGYSLASGPKIKFLPLPYFKGPIGFFFKYWKLRNSVHAYLNTSEKVILRVPTSGLSDIACAWLRKKSRPYAVEVVADPYDVLSKGSMKNLMRRYFQLRLTRSLKRICYHAKYASYVTEFSLQKRYPSDNSIFNTWYSDIKVEASDIAKDFRRAVDIAQKKELNIIVVGTMSHVLYKAQDILIKAMKLVLSEVPKAKLILVGDGENRAYLEKLSENLQLQERIDFLGYVSGGQEIYKLLDEADLFVLPSRQEGLPRAMLEAFARGLPCIGSNVGGIPELLDQDYLVEPNDEIGLAKCIIEVLTDYHLMENMSRDNLEKSKRYSKEYFEDKRLQFYKLIRDD